MAGVSSYDLNSTFMTKPMARRLGFSCDCGGPDQSRADCDVCTPSFKPGASMTFITVANSGLPSGDKARYSPSRQPRVTRKLAHAASAGDITQGRTNQTAIARIFVNARLKIQSDVFLGRKVNSQVPPEKLLGFLFFSHDSSLPMFRNCDGTLDVSVLRPFYAACQKHNPKRAKLYKISSRKQALRVQVSVSNLRMPPSHFRRWIQARDSPAYALLATGRGRLHRALAGGHGPGQ